MQPIQSAAVFSNSGGEKPAIVCVGFRVLFDAGHIPGAHYLGPGREREGVEGLKKWAQGVRRDRLVVLYCGCCPWRECPNIRPAFAALKSAGLKRIAVLKIDRDFGRDWVAKGYPVAK